MLFLRKIRMFLPIFLFFLFLGFNEIAIAEDLILKDLNGVSVNLSNHKGKPAILFFWTTWCHFCRNEIKALNQNYNQLEKEGIAVFAIDIGEPDYRVQKFFKENGLSFRVLLDREGLVSDKYNVIGVPTYILLDQSGRVVSAENRLPADYKSLFLK